MRGRVRSRQLPRRRGHRPQTRAARAVPRPLLGGLAGAPWPKVEGAKWREGGADAVCSLGCYAARFRVRCAVGQHPPAATRVGRPLVYYPLPLEWARLPVAARPRGVRAARCGLWGRPGAGARREGAGGRGTYSRFARISLPDPHLYRPSEHRSEKHEKAGTSVTFFATP